MLFFLIILLCVIEHMYQFSLDSFVAYLYKAIDRTQPAEDVKERTILLMACIRLTIFRWVNRGLFERHKLIFCGMLTFRLLQRNLLKEEYVANQYQFLLRGPTRSDV